MQSWYELKNLNDLHVLQNTNLVKMCREYIVTISRDEKMRKVNICLLSLIDVRTNIGGLKSLRKYHKHSIIPVWGADIWQAKANII